MISYSTDIARVKGRVTRMVHNIKEEILLETVLTRGFIDVGNSIPEKVSKKKLLVNGISKRMVDFAGNFKVTLFGPWDLDLVTESPTHRRRFMDTVISQVDREYRRASLSYEKGLRQRNRLLLRIREEGLSRSQLLYWNHLLIKNGDYLSEKRDEFIAFVNSTGKLNKQQFLLTYDRSAISEARLEEYADEEIAAATTLVGPHRDDFIFKKEEERELARFGSRGEQRMGVLWIKLAELSFVEEKTNERPTLLLDDIFSELDHKHRDVVVKLCEKQQTVVTTVDPHYVTDFKKVEKIRLES